MRIHIIALTLRENRITLDKVFLDGYRLKFLAEIGKDGLHWVGLRIPQGLNRFISQASVMITENKLLFSDIFRLPRDIDIQLQLLAGVDEFVILQGIPFSDVRDADIEFFRDHGE